MRVLFLDFDGVLNSFRWMKANPGKSFACEVDPEPVALVAEIVRRTGAQIVVSSTWRIHHRLAALRDVLITAGYPAPCPIIGATPKSVPHPEPDYKHKRGFEIQAWLDAQPPDGPRAVEQIAILDDDTDMSHLLPRLVQTDVHEGLQREHVERVVALLRGT